jgi:hypothetical protein
MHEYYVTGRLMRVVYNLEAQRIEESLCFRPGKEVAACC